MPRFEKPNDKAWSRKVNRGALSREQLHLLGYRGDVDPSRLIFMDDEASNDWVNVSGSVQIATGAERGTKWASQNLRGLDSVNEEAYVQLTAGAGNLPAGAYRLRLRVRGSASVANDLGIRVENFTDGTVVLAQVLRTPVDTPKEVEALFSVRAADVGDALRVYVKKVTSTANFLYIDFVSITPVSAQADVWGKVPEGGRIEYTVDANGKVTAHSILDASSGGNVIESGAYTYNATDADQLDSLAYTRDGVTMTESFTYDASGFLTKNTRSIPA